MAAADGIEPPPPGSEPGVLPIYEAAMSHINYAYLVYFVSNILFDIV